jgi:hypothetical protein
VRALSSSAEGSQGGGGGSAPQRPRSLLDAQLPELGGRGGGSIVASSAAAASAAAAAAAAGGGQGGAGAAGAAPRGPFRRLVSGLFDALLVSSLALLLGGGVLYANTSVADVQQQLQDAKAAADKEPGLLSQAKVAALEVYLAAAVPVERKVCCGLACMLCGDRCPRAACTNHACLRLRALARVQA